MQNGLVMLITEKIDYSPNTTKSFKLLITLRQNNRSSHHAHTVILFQSIERNEDRNKQ